MSGEALAVFSHCRQIKASMHLDLSGRLHQTVPGDFRAAHLTGRKIETVDEAQRPLNRP